MVATRFPGGVTVRALLLVAAMSAVAAAQPAEAPRTDQHLVWLAPEGCPGPEQVRARIEQRLRLPISVVHGIAVTIEPTESGSFIARVDPAGVTVSNVVRTLTSPGCDELTDAVAVIVARIAAEARGLGWDEEPTMIRRSIPVPFEPPPPPSTWGGGLRVLGVSGIGALPQVNVGGELAAYVRHETMFVEVAASMWGIRNRALSQGAPAGVGVSLDLGTLRVGWQPPTAPLRAWGGLEVGSMSGTGTQVDNPSMGSAVWVAADVGFGVAWPMSPHAKLVGSLEFAAVFARPRFVLGDGSPIYQPAPMAARTSFGIEVGWE